MKQHNLFDGPLSDHLKTEGMAKAADNAPTALQLARNIADELYRQKGVVNADDVGRVLKQRYGIDTLGPASGSLFRDRKWKFTGRWVKSKRITNHSRMIREWTMR